MVDGSACGRQIRLSIAATLPYGVASKARDSYKAAHYKTAIERAKLSKRSAKKSRSTKKRGSSGSAGGIDRDHIPTETYND